MPHFIVVANGRATEFLNLPRRALLPGNWKDGKPEGESSPLPPPPTVTITEKLLRAARAGTDVMFFFSFY